jgi:hypothetical protein
LLLRWSCPRHFPTNDTIISPEKAENGLIGTKNIQNHFFGYKIHIISTKYPHCRRRICLIQLWRTCIDSKLDTQGFRGIVLLETNYKIISMIIHQHFTSTIKLHEEEHGFQTKRGTGTATINFKLVSDAHIP